MANITASSELYSKCTTGLLPEFDEKSEKQSSTGSIHVAEGLRTARKELWSHWIPC